MSKPSVMILISGRGSNMQSLVEQAASYSVCEVLSNRADAPGLKYACDRGIAVSVYERSAYATLGEQKQAIYKRVAEIRPDLIALAGFMVILEPSFTEQYYGRLINVHPALLPDYPGIDTHARVLAAGGSRHGCSVHYVDSGVDTGPIIAQAVLELGKNETPETLAGRVLKLEHRIYPWALNAVARNEIRLNGREVTYTPQVVEEARNLGFLLMRTS